MSGGRELVTEMRSLVHLERAVNALVAHTGQVLEEKKRIRMYGKRTQLVDYGVELPGSYDAGFNRKKAKDEEGNEIDIFTMVGDEELFSGNARAAAGYDIIGHNGHKITQEYVYQQMLDEAEELNGLLYRTYDAAKQTMVLELHLS